MDRIKVNLIPNNYHYTFCGKVKRYAPANCNKCKFWDVTVCTHNLNPEKYYWTYLNTINQIKDV